MSRSRKIGVLWLAGTLLVALIVVIGIVLLGDKGPGQGLPDVVAAAPAPVREAYAYAVEHPEVLQYMPCYCGCAAAGHASNEDCFIDERLPDGRIVYDLMGAT